MPPQVGRHYTSQPVARALAQLVGFPEGEVLDLCSGGGALSGGFDRDRLRSVDIDPTAPPVGHVHLVADALDEGLTTSLGRPGGFDVVLCNPPYGTLPDTPGARAAASGGGIPHTVPPGRRLDSAWTFCARAIGLARPGGTVALVIPDGLATGLGGRAFREALVSRHRLTHAVSLPRRAFGGTEARAMLLILRKDRPADRRVELVALDRGGDLTPPVIVAPEWAMSRLDHGHHAVMAGATGPTLRDLGAVVARGRLPASYRGTGAFRTDGFPSGPGRLSLALGDDGNASGHPYLAHAGDIVMARVDRNLHRKVGLVRSGSAAPTDLVLRVRLPVDFQFPVARALLSPEGERRLAATARGTGARTISTRDLMGMPLPLGEDFIARC